MGCRVKAIHLGYETNSGLLHPSVAIIGLSFIYITEKLLWAYKFSAKQALVFCFLKTEKRKGKGKEKGKIFVLKDIMIPTKNVLYGWVILLGFPAYQGLIKLNSIVIGLIL